MPRPARGRGSACAWTRRPRATRWRSRPKAPAGPTRSAEGARSRRRADPRRPAPAARQGQLELRGPVDAGLHPLVVLAVAVGVEAVLVGVHLESALGEE